MSGALGEADQPRASSRSAAQPARSALAIVGVVIGIVTVVLVASTLVGLRNSVALLFRELGTDNIFAFHYNGEPYSAGSSQDVKRPPLKPEFAERIAALGPSIREVGIELIVPAVTSTRAITARAGANESDSRADRRHLAELLRRRRRGLRGGPAVHRLRGARPGPGRGAGRQRRRAPCSASSRPWARRSCWVAIATYVVGELAPRKGTFFGENRNDTVVALPVNTARQKFPDAENTVLYIRADLDGARRRRLEAATILRLVRNVPPGEPDNFALNTADQIIAQFDKLGLQIFLATIALAAVSLLIGGIGIANVMVISVTERTREIGVRLAIGARRSEVRRQFLLEAAILSGAGGSGRGRTGVRDRPAGRVRGAGLSGAPPLWAVASA